MPDALTDEIEQLVAEVLSLTKQRNHYRQALESIAHPNRTKTGMKELARKALYEHTSN